MPVEEGLKVTAAEKNEAEEGGEDGKMCAREGMLGKDVLSN